MQKSLLKAALIGSALLFVAGCSKHPSSKTFLLPVLNASGDAELKEVTLDTLSDTSEVSGEAARVLYNPLINDGGVSGNPTKTQLSESGDVLIPMDFATSAALSVYHSYENIKKFEARVLPDFPMSWPRTVGIDLFFADGYAVNNAFYAGLYDFTGVGSYSMGDLPLTFNSGILAHEHFHAHFYRIMGEDLEILPSLKDPHLVAAEGKSGAAACGLESEKNLAVSAQDPNFIKAVNHFILRGWNEGLADFYAAIVSGNTKFFDSSYDLKGIRNVDAPALGVVSRLQVEAALAIDLMASSSRECLSMKLAYSMGTQVARTLYANMKEGKIFEIGALNTFGLSKEEVALRTVFRRLTKARQEINTRAQTGKLDPAWIVELIAKPDPWTVR